MIIRSSKTSYLVITLNRHRPTDCKVHTFILLDSLINISNGTRCGHVGVAETILGDTSSNLLVTFRMKQNWSCVHDLFCNDACLTERQTVQSKGSIEDRNTINTVQWSSDFALNSSTDAVTIWQTTNSSDRTVRLAHNTAINRDDISNHCQKWA